MQYSVSAYKWRGHLISFEFRDGQRELGRERRQKKILKKNKKQKNLIYAFGASVLHVSMLAPTMLMGLATEYTFGVTMFNKKIQLIKVLQSRRAEKSSSAVEQTEVGIFGQACVMMHLSKASSY